MLKMYRDAGALLGAEDSGEELTLRERERLARIKSMPKIARDVCIARREELYKQIKELERERDNLIDYLNGEDVVWDTK